MAGLTPVEARAMAGGEFAGYVGEGERITTLVVDSFPALGRLTACRFLEWVQSNPEGVVALPTGKTPEYFIQWVRHLVGTWEERETQRHLEAWGLDGGRKPALRGLRFVQIDEFYPMPSWQENSFAAYVKRFYVEGFGLAEGEALLIRSEEVGLEPGQRLEDVWPEMTVDLTLRHRAARSPQEELQQAVLHRVDGWCQAYEERIRALGGIGFFLGGIGPDGHVAFNVRGTDHFSTTRLTALNYETQAAAATDLGGMEVSRRRLAITIGLGTITARPDATAVIMAAGETKAGVVAAALGSEPDVLYPATALQKLAGARFYLTAGAARDLAGRRVYLVERAEAASDEAVERALVDVAVRRGKGLLSLTEGDLEGDAFAQAVRARRVEGLGALCGMVHERLASRVEAGARTRRETVFLHTEPHHDDVMLGCLPAVVRHIRDASNRHEFVTLTSGFTSVTNAYMAGQIAGLRHFLGTTDFRELMGEAGYFDPANRTARNRDVWQYLDGVAAGSEVLREEGAARRLLRNLMGLYGETEPDGAVGRLAGLERYFQEAYPGQKDPEPIQLLKGMCREWEAECLWGYFGWDTESVHHLRLGFYTGDIFTPEPTRERDVPPIRALLDRVRPDVVSMALDPEASGPDTHYKALQALTEAVRGHVEEGGGSGAMRLWGYRNVWHRFHPSEANVYVPVSLNMFAVMHSAFLNSFVSQREASFPSYEHDGPFCELARQIQVAQYQALKTCLGRRWWYEHESPLIRATRGLVFMREMDLAEFYARSRELRRRAEEGCEG
jgi:glucosamine-6-phosphate deaminase